MEPHGKIVRGYPNLCRDFLPRFAIKVYSSDRLCMLSLQQKALRMQALAYHSIQLCTLIRGKALSQFGRKRQLHPSTLRLVAVKISDHSRQDSTKPTPDRFNIANVGRPIKRPQEERVRIRLRLNALLPLDERLLANA